jgi:hypothetical protein
MYYCGMRKNSFKEIVSDLRKVAEDIKKVDPEAVYKKVTGDPLKYAPTIINNAKQVGVKGYPGFVTKPIISAVEGNVSEYAKKLPTFNPEKIKKFITDNPGIFRGVKNTAPSNTLAA